MAFMQHADMVYKYETFEPTSIIIEEDSEEYGHFVDLENMEPVEIVEYYVVRSVYRGQYDVRRKSVKNPRYTRRIIKMNIDNEEDIHKIPYEYLDTSKNSSSNSSSSSICSLFRCFCRRTYMIFISVSISVVFLCNMKNSQVVTTNSKMAT